MLRFHDFVLLFTIILNFWHSQLKGIVRLYVDAFLIGLYLFGKK